MKEGLLQKLYSSDYNQLQVTHPDLSVIEETVQRLYFFTGFYKWKLNTLCIKLVRKE